MAGILAVLATTDDTRTCQAVASCDDDADDYITVQNYLSASELDAAVHELEALYTAATPKRNLLAAHSGGFTAQREDNKS